MRSLIFISSILLYTACNGQNNLVKDSSVIAPSNTIEEYCLNHKEDSKESKSTGTVGAGTLVNGKLLPFNGANYYYFDTLSYLNGRAFLNSKTRKTVIESYKKLETDVPGRKFCIMECSSKEGGKLFPHRTHQNGLSIDFMMPLVKDNKPYYRLDTLGAAHYWLTFDRNGNYSEDVSVTIDFNLVARHILLLNEIGKKHGLKVSKVIINTEFKDKLYATTYGKQLQAKGIYVVKSLTPLINSLHDDHYHIDFEEIN